MAIFATTAQRELIPAGTYAARCYQMIQIGTIEEEVMGVKKMLNKIRIGWELPTETKIFKEGENPRPLVISKEYTLSLGEKANLRKTLASWRGKDFTADEVKSFDITKLLGVQCLINIIHKPSKDGSKHYEEIASISPLPKGMDCPAQFNDTFVFEFDNYSDAKLETLPDFIKTRIKTSDEYKAIQAAFSQEQQSVPLQQAISQALNNNALNNNDDDLGLPF